MIKKKKITITISKKHSGQRLDQALTIFFANYSRSYIKKLILNQCIIVNNDVCIKPKRKMLGGETIVINFNIEEKIDFKPQDIPLDILYEDRDIIIINKPSNFVVHPGIGHPDGTLLNALLKYYPPIEKIPRAGIIHRLDKDTTGLMIIAKTIPAQIKLIESLKLRNIIREYEALTIGHVKENGKIEQPISRHPKKRTCMSVNPMGKFSTTYYRIIEYFRMHTRLRLRLKTGRTHQIRVHMKYIAHPLVGDKLYGIRNRLPKGSSKSLIEVLSNINRQALHATMLRFHHPISGIKMEWHSPLPKDMIELINIMREDFEKYKKYM